MGLGFGSVRSTLITWLGLGLGLGLGSSPCLTLTPALSASPTPSPDHRGGASHAAEVDGEHVVAHPELLGVRARGLGLGSSG